MSVQPGVKYENVIWEPCQNVKCGKRFMVPLNYWRVYLARTFSVSDPKYKYPVHVKSHFSGVLDFVDPLDYKDAPNWRKNPEEIVSFDKNLIDECDIFVAFINQPTFGTLGELHYAHNKDMMTYVINGNGVHMNDPWLKYIVDGMYEDTDKCYYDLINLAVRIYNAK